jgi:hypothetical protein
MPDLASSNLVRLEIGVPLDTFAEDELRSAGLFLDVASRF